MEWKVSFHRMNAFYISLLTMKSYIAFGTVYSERAALYLEITTVRSSCLLFSFFRIARYSDSTWLIYALKVLRTGENS
jgi:hypothetical protein